MAEAVDLSRRQFLNTTVNAIGAVITAIIAVPLAGYFIDPALRRGGGAASWIKVAPVASLTPTPAAFTVAAEKLEGFMKENVKATVYAFTGTNGSAVALSNTCTHLGCPVSYSSSDSQFHCPCHGSVFSKAGDVTHGPAPKSLPAYETKIENGDLYVKVV